MNEASPGSSIVASSDRLCHTAAKVGFLADFFCAVDPGQLLLSDDGLFGLIEILRHIQQEIEAVEAALA